MNDFCKLPDLNDTAQYWLPAIRRSGFIIYWMVIGMFISGFISLFFVRVDISVRATGMIRPYNERTEIHSPAGGTIENIYFKEGDLVVKNNILLTIQEPALGEKQQLSDSEILHIRDFIRDLEILTAAERPGVNILQALICPLYKQEALRYISKSAEQQILLTKAKYETMLNEKLAKDKVISPKEMFDIRIQEQKIISENRTFRHEQLAHWQAELVKYKTELNQHISRKEELNQLLETYSIRAPVSGYIQELNKHYPGTSIQAGELIYTISPGGLLMGECYIPSKDMGMLKMGQEAKFQIDAFNYNYFGTATGEIFSIGNDFILMENTPVYKVKCRLNENMLKLSNGYTGELKKGMAFRVRFKICNRTLWQLLYGTLEDWLSPARQPV